MLAILQNRKRSLHGCVADDSGLMNGQIWWEVFWWLSNSKLGEWLEGQFVFAISIRSIRETLLRFGCLYHQCSDIIMIPHLTISILIFKDCSGILFAEMLLAYYEFQLLVSFSVRKDRFIWLCWSWGGLLVILWRTCKHSLFTWLRRLRGNCLGVVQTYKDRRFMSPQYPPSTSIELQSVRSLLMATLFLHLLGWKSVELCVNC